MINLFFGKSVASYEFVFEAFIIELPTTKLPRFSSAAKIVFLLKRKTDLLSITIFGSLLQITSFVHWLFCYRQLNSYR